ncbi:MAG: pirin family protein [Actinomycetes bacterium]
MDAETLLPRLVPLGGQRAMLVRRTLPHRDVRTIGAFCFVDHYGSSDAGADPTGPMVVPPHPHMGLQTVSWLLQGAIEHHDSVGSIQTIHPGELNLMTAGSAISHSEYSVANDQASNSQHGLQLWVALPETDRHQAPHFEHHGDLPTVTEAGLACTVVLGTLMGQTSNAATYSDLVCAEVSSAVGQHVLEVTSDHEHGLLPLDDEILVGGERVPRGALRYEPPGQSTLTFDSPRSTRLLLIGGAPFEEELLMWWNFVGRSHDEIVEARDAWESGNRFGTVVADESAPLRAPQIPTVRLKPRPSHRR